MGKGRKKATTRRKTTTVKGLPVKDSKAVKGGGPGGGHGTGKVNTQDIHITSR